MLKKAVDRIENTKSEKVTDSEVLKQEIQKRKKEIKNLITAIAKSGGNEEFVNQIEQEITKLNEECANLEKEIGKIGEEGICIGDDKQQMEVLIEQLSSFKNLFDTLSVVEKREYLNMILDKVVWDGDEAHIFIYGSH